MISSDVPDSPVQIILGEVWREFGPRDGWKILSNLSHLAKDPFRWHTVLESLSRGSTWPGTGLGYRLLLGSVFLGERNVECDSRCMYCGHRSNFQFFLHSILTALNYPRAPSVGSSSPSNLTSSGEGFINTFVRFIIDLFVSDKSPFRAEIGSLVSSLSPSDKRCLIHRLPGLVTFFRKLDHDEGREIFFIKLAKWFKVDESLFDPKQLSISSFFLVIAAKGWEAATVEGGRRFDRMMIAGVVEFFSCEKSDTKHASLVPFDKSPSLPMVLDHPEIVARTTIELVRCSLASMFIPPTDWGAISGTMSAEVENFLRSGKPLERCSAFMEPSTVLMILRHMLSRPGAIPNLKGSNEGRFDYSVENIRIRNFDLSRSLCNVKGVKSGTPSTGGDRADLLVTVKEVNLQIDHDWHIEWTGQKFVSYRGTNTVRVRGLSSQIFLSLFADDQGPVVTRSSISLGSVEHSCRIGNANIVSEILAQTALDWFAEPLTRLLQSASQTAVDQMLKDLNVQFRVDVWNGLVLRIFPHCVIQDIVGAIRDHLPAHGVPL